MLCQLLVLIRVFIYIYNLKTHLCQIMFVCLVEWGCLWLSQKDCMSLNKQTETFTKTRPITLQRDRRMTKKHFTISKHELDWLLQLRVHWHLHFFPDTPNSAVVSINFCSKPFQVVLVVPLCLFISLCMTGWFICLITLFPHLPKFPPDPCLSVHFAIFVGELSSFHPISCPFSTFHNCFPSWETRVPQWPKRFVHQALFGSSMMPRRNSVTRNSSEELILWIVVEVCLSCTDVASIARRITLGQAIRNSHPWWHWCRDTTCEFLLAASSLLFRIMGGVSFPAVALPLLPGASPWNKASVTMLNLAQRQWRHTPKHHSRGEEFHHCSSVWS